MSSRKKRQKDGKKDKNKPEKGVKGGHETYSKGNRTRKENSPPKPRNHTKPRHAKSRQKEEKGKDALDKQGKKKDESLHLQRPRLTAYEEYTQGVQVYFPKLPSFVPEDFVFTTFQLQWSSSACMLVGSLCSTLAAAISKAGMAYQQTACAAFEASSAAQGHRLFFYLALTHNLSILSQPSFQVLRPSADLQKRSKSSTPAKRGVMDEEELNRLKKYQSKEKLKSFW